MEGGCTAEETEALCILREASSVAVRVAAGTLAAAKRQQHKAKGDAAQRERKGALPPHLPAKFFSTRCTPGDRYKRPY